MRDGVSSYEYGRVRDGQNASNKLGANRKKLNQRKNVEIKELKAAVKMLQSMVEAKNEKINRLESQVDFYIHK